MNRIFKKNRIVPVLPSTGIDNRAETPDYKISSKVKCKNCRKYFDENNNTECLYHPRDPKTEGLRIYNQYDEVIHPCCGKVQKGFEPILIDAPGCVKKDKHEKF